MKKTIILFQPKFWPGPLNNEKPRSKKYYTGLRETFKYPPWGLLSVGSALTPAYDVRIIDERFDENWRQTVSMILKNSDVLFAGATACTGFDIRGALDFSKFIRKSSPDLPVVWGGWHASAIPEQTIVSEFVDVVVRGQGEWTALELAERLQAGSRDFSGIAGLTHRTAAGAIVNEPARDLRSAGETPETDFSLVEMNNYLRFKDGSKARLFYVSSLGCPYNCTFCSVASVYHRHFSSKPPERVIREIRYFVDNYGVDSVEFDGTIFFVNTRWTEEVLTGMIEAGLDLDCVTTTRADLILRWDAGMKDLVRRAGFKVIGVGGESGSPRMLKRIDKRIKVDDIVESLKVLKELDVDPCYTFMFGLPGETIEDSLMTLDLMLRLKQVMPECRTAGLFYHPFPGSEMYEEYKRLHGLPDLSLEEWAEYSFDVKFTTRSLSLDKNYADFIKKRLQYFEWAFPEHEEGHGRLRRLATRISRARVMNGIYYLPVEWTLAKSMGKISFD
ncbi:MAG: B12-binding domain-containing radical SAM protein [Thermoleophilia bacterium]|nr:B12-binding domain-containing radical SAM protein [Thermoleophilia bacterium]